MNDYWNDPGFNKPPEHDPLGCIVAIVIGVALFAFVVYLCVSLGQALGDSM